MKWSIKLFCHLVCGDRNAFNASYRPLEICHLKKGRGQFKGNTNVVVFSAGGNESPIQKHTTAGGERYHLSFHGCLSFVRFGRRFPISPPVITYTHTHTRAHARTHARTHTHTHTHARTHARTHTHTQTHTHTHARTHVYTYARTRARAHTHTHTHTHTHARTH